MPGDHWSPHITKVASAVTAATAPGSNPQCVPTTAEEVSSLLAVLDFSGVSAIVDPFSGTGTIKQQFSKAGYTVSTNDISTAHTADQHADATQPSYYQTLSAADSLHAVVTSPWFTVLDIVLPLAVLCATRVVCMHVPGSYLTSAPVPRLRYLQGLQQSGRLMVIMGLPRGPVGRKCVWLVVFKNAWDKQRMIKQDFKQHDYVLLG
eukprot:jgi/Chrzof1/10780/Cz05g11270.t1